MTHSYPMMIRATISPPRFLVSAALSVVLSITLAGCAQELSEEERHLEHFVPPHKPANYAAAVDELENRSPTFLDGKVSKVQHAELGDIIGWIPELAGNSDLLRPQWEQARSISTELADIHASTVGKAVAEAHRRSWQQHMIALREMVAAAGRPESLPAHHEHDHHDEDESDDPGEMNERASNPVTAATQPKSTRIEESD